MPSKKRTSISGTQKHLSKNKVKVAVVTENGRISKTNDGEIVSINPQRVKVTLSCHSYSSKTGRYKKCALYRSCLNKSVRGRYTTVYEEGPGGKGDGGNPPIISVSIEE